MKLCSKCGVLKSLDQFGVRNSAKDKLQFSCKPCVRERNRNYYYSDKERSSAQRSANYQKNRTRLLEYRRDYYAENSTEILLRTKRQRARDGEEYLAKARKWAKNNRDKINRYIKHRYNSDKKFRQKETLRKLLRGYLERAGQEKGGRTRELLGYSPSDFAMRMEVQFKPGMSWDNYGDWHIDHKIPVAHFIKKGESRPHIVNALCNLQPLWASENLAKRDTHPLRQPI